MVVLLLYSVILATSFYKATQKILCLKACDRLEDQTLPAGFFFFSFFFPSAETLNLSQSQPLSSMKYGTWFLDEQDTTLK